MCFAPSIPKPPPPVMPPKPQDAEAAATALARRLSVRQGYAASIATSPGGSRNYGGNSQVPGLSAGTSATLGTGA